MRFFLFKITVDFTVMWEYTVSTGGVSMAFNIKLAVKNAILGLRGVEVKPLLEEPLRVVSVTNYNTETFVVRTQISRLDEDLLVGDIVDFRQYKEDDATQMLAKKLSESGAITHSWQKTSEDRTQLVSYIKVAVPKE